MYIKDAIAVEIVGRHSAISSRLPHTLKKPVTCNRSKSVNYVLNIIQFNIYCRAKVFETCFYHPDKSS